MSTNEATEDKVREKVRTGYANIAKKGIFTTIEDEASTCSPGGGCCGGNTFDVEELVKMIGYSKEELDSAPESARRA